MHLSLQTRESLSKDVVRGFVVRHFLIATTVRTPEGGRLTSDPLSQATVLCRCLTLAKGRRGHGRTAKSIFAEFSWCAIAMPNTSRAGLIQDPILVAAL